MSGQPAPAFSASLGLLGTPSLSQDTAKGRLHRAAPSTKREIGEVGAFLARPRASYVTGETIFVDGGRLGLLQRLMTMS